MIDELLSKITYFLTVDVTIRFLIWYCNKFNWQVNIEFQGLENVPESEATILVSTHKDWRDVPIMPSLTKRRTHMISKKELYEKNFWQTWWMNHVYTICVDREEARHSTFKVTTQVLRSGGVLGIFPEGTRSKELLLFQGGAATIAIMSRVDAWIVPIAMAYKDVNLTSKKTIKKIFVNIGKPFKVYSVIDGITDRKEKIAKLTQVMQEKVTELYHEAQARL